MFSALIDVHGDEQVTRLFSEESFIAAWLEVERALADAQASHGVIPAEAAATIADAAQPRHIDISRLRERSRVVGYPILPLLEELREHSPAAARYLHWGATTQDIMDSGVALVTKRALDRVQTLTCELGDALASRAEQHRDTLMTGRTHAQPAVPITFGTKLAVWLAEITRHRERLRAAQARIAVVQLFGAAGTAAALGARSREVRHEVARRLGLAAVDVPWHTARDGIAEVGFALAVLAGTCGKIGREVVELSRPEIGELREPGGHHRGASSTMPQKSNPIDSEAVIGMSILAANHLGALLSALQGTHERAAGEWQAEWDALPGLVAAAAGAVATTGRLLTGLVVSVERMRANLDHMESEIMAEAAMMAIAALAGRAAAHDAVYEASRLARAGGVPLATALQRTLDDELLEALPPLATVLDPAGWIGESDSIVSAAVEGWRGSR